MKAAENSCNFAAVGFEWEQFLKRGADMKRGLLALAVLCVVSAANAQAQTILENEHAKMRAQFQAAQASGTKPSFEQRAETVQQLTPELTASQLKKFEVLMVERHERGPGEAH